MRAGALPALLDLMPSGEAEPLFRLMNDVHRLAALAEKQDRKRGRELYNRILAAIYRGG